MGKRRTRKDKEKALHQFTISWDDRQEKTLPEASVNRQKANAVSEHNPIVTENKNAILMAIHEPAEAIKKDLIKSMLLVSFILGLELVIYLAWNVNWNIRFPFFR
jgi:hypothetical protein